MSLEASSTGKVASNYRHSAQPFVEINKLVRIFQHFVEMSDDEIEAVPGDPG
jgi:hypothetical protein